MNPGSSNLIFDIQQLDHFNDLLALNDYTQLLFINDTQQLDQFNETLALNDP